MSTGIKYFVSICFFLMLFIGKNEKTFSQDKDYKAYTLFLYNFMKYIEWPEEANEFVIGIAGESPIQKELLALSEVKKIKGKKIVVKIISSAEEASSCSMVYIPSSKSSMLKLIAEKTKGKPVLIVAEREGLAKKGAAISFVVDEDDTLKFDLNKSALESQTLKAANLLIQLGIMVG